MQRSFSSSVRFLCRLAPATIAAVVLCTAPSMAASTGAASTPETYFVTFHLVASSSNVVAGLQWRTNYSAATGVFRGSNALVSCTSPTTGLFAPQDVDATKMLTLAVLTSNGFAPPAELATCVFDGFTNDPPVAGDFLVTIEDQTDEQGNPVTSIIGVTISAGVTLCGNGAVNGGEQCDDANSLNTDACTNACQNAKCGDGYVRAGLEQCDDGNTIDDDACTNSCEDQATQNLQCTVVFALPDDVNLGSLQWSTDYGDVPGYLLGESNHPECYGLVDGVLAAFFDADADRTFNSGLIAGSGFSGPTDLVECDFEVTEVPLESDFAVRVDVADDPLGVAIVPLPTVEIASIVCDGVTGCGNGTVEDPEQCDDGNAINTDACVECTNAVCGDGFVRSGVEQCDDGNLSNTDVCLNSCKSAVCGDGFVRAGLEQCDDGNSVSTDACTGICATAKCGDGHVRAGVEQCDDGNAVNTDACPGTCKAAVCGDGYRRSGVEECDDANSLDGDGCSSMCETQQLCGDATDDGTLFASDALRILQRAVGMDVECPTWVCDVDGTNGVAASDALRLLRKSVDLPVMLSCGDPTAIVLRITTSTMLGSLQINIGYQDVAGEISGSGGTVACEAVQPGMQSAFNDKPDRVLSASFVSLSGIHGPGALARCDFTTDTDVAPEDFAVTVLDAKDKAGNTVVKPGVKVVPD